MPKNEALNPADVWTLWTPRMSLGGVEYQDLETARALAPTWIEWIDVWTAHGAKHRAKAEELKAAGSSHLRILRAIESGAKGAAL